MQQEGLPMEDFTTLISQLSGWLQARNLDPKNYSLAIVASDQRALAAVQGELNASIQREDWRPAWKSGGVEVHGITIETKLRDDPESKPRDFRMSDLPAMIFWPLVIVQIAFFAWLVFSTVAWWRL
jgi:hypothetical protein